MEPRRNEVLGITKAREDKAHSSVGEGDFLFLSNTQTLAMPLVVAIFLSDAEFLGENHFYELIYSTELTGQLTGSLSRRDTAVPNYEPLKQ